MTELGVETMRGRLAMGDLGRVLVHEHIFTFNFEYTFNYRPDFFQPSTIERAVTELNALKAAGVDTIIDLTVLGLGRYMPGLLEVAAKTDLNIVLATGAYTLNEVPTPFALYGPGLLCDAPEPMVDHFFRDITEGIGGTGVKAGELKCAIDKLGLTPGVERVMRAVGRTHVLTGVPVTVHTDAVSHSGLVAQRVLAEEGVDLEDVIIGHCGDTDELDYLMRLADAGSLLGMDRCGIYLHLSLADKVRTIVAMVERGYIDHLTISHDCFIFSDHFPQGEPRKSVLPDHNFLHISQHLIPALLEAGLSQRQIDTMMIDNPRRHFEAAAKRFARRG
jgi:phosphotriesterase-related protein